LEGDKMVEARCLKMLRDGSRIVSVLLKFEGVLPEQVKLG